MQVHHTVEDACPEENAVRDAHVLKPPTPGDAEAGTAPDVGTQLSIFVFSSVLFSFFLFRPIKITFKKKTTTNDNMYMWCAHLGKIPMNCCHIPFYIAKVQGYARSLLQPLPGDSWWQLCK